MPDVMDIGVFDFIFFIDLPAPGTGKIIDNNQLEILEILLQAAINTPAKIFFSIENRNNNAQLRTHVIAT